MSAVGSATISLGLVSIAVKTYAVTASTRPRFTTLHKKCGSRLVGASSNALCPVDNCVVERSDQVKGYEFAKNQYVSFTEDELTRCGAARSSVLEIKEFVPRASIDVVYFGKPLYLGPSSNCDRAYQLLAVAMRKTNTIAVGRYTTRGRNRLVFISPYQHGLMMHFGHFAPEVRSFDDSCPGAAIEFTKEDVETAVDYIARNIAPKFAPDKYLDEQRNDLYTAIEQKVVAKAITIAEERPNAEVIDLFEALKRSIAESTPPNVRQLRPRSNEEEA